VIHEINGIKQGAVNGHFTTHWHTEIDGDLAGAFLDRPGILTISTIQGRAETLRSPQWVLSGRKPQLEAAREE
jgi:hypothetical protein